MSTYTPNDISGWMTHTEQEWLFNEARKYKSIVEVGSWKGRSTHALCSGCSGIVIAVDHFMGSVSERKTVHKEATERDIYVDFHNNVGHFKNLSVLRMDSSLAASLFRPKSIDMVFIDGDHEYPFVLSDMAHWNVVAKHLFCGHDIGGQVTKALNELRIPVVVTVGSIWMKVNSIVLPKDATIDNPKDGSRVDCSVNLSPLSMSLKKGD